MAAQLLLIDNYDSFTYNLLHLFQQHTALKIVVKRDHIDLLGEIDQYCGIIISPGPGTPQKTRSSLEMIRQFYQQKPVFGVCLGMQCINEAFGGETVRTTPVHGKSDQIKHNNHPLFSGIPEYFDAARYHSLKINPAPDLNVIARNHHDIPMALTHPDYPIYGIQFHPESFMTPCGGEIVNNFLHLAGLC